MTLVVAALAVAIAVSLALAVARAGAAPVPLTEFKLQPGDTAGSLIDGPGGALWFGDESSASVPRLGRITTSGAITTKQVASAGDIGDVANGANGTIWFTLIGTVSHAIGERTASGQIKIFTPGMDGLNPGAIPVELAEGANGAVWFIDHANAAYSIGEIKPSGSIVEYPTGGYDPDALTATSNGNAWFTVAGPPGQIGTVTAGASPGSMAKVYPTGSMTMPTEITAGDDGNVWFSNDGTPAAVGRVTPNGGLMEFGSAHGLQMSADPDALTAGPDGNVWFQDQYATKPAVGRITPSGKIKEFALSHEAWDLTVGIDRNIWLATGDNGGTNPGVARVIPATGKVQFFSAGLGPGAVVGDGTNIVSGPDGNLWLIDIGTPEAIVRASVGLGPVASTGAATMVTGSSARATGSVNARGASTTVTVAYGRTRSLGSTTAAGTIPSSDVAHAVSASLKGLRAGTTVYYRVQATNSYGSSSGAIHSFKTTAASGKTIVKSVGGRQFTIGLPSTSACLAGRLAVTVRASKLARSQASTLRFRSLAAYLDRGRAKTRFRRRHHHRVKLTVHVPNATAKHLPSTLRLSLRHLHAGPHHLRLVFTFARSGGHGHLVKTVRVAFRTC